MKFTAPRAVLATGAVAGLSAMIFRTKVLNPRVIAQQNDWNKAVLALCPHFETPYELPYNLFLNNGHVETIIAALFRCRPHILYDRDLVQMPDGGVVALDSEDLQEESDRLPADAPVLLLLPGLTGGSEDSYVQHAVVHARSVGIRAVVFNSRGTSESPVTTAQFYSASYTGDLVSSTFLFLSFFLFAYDFRSMGNQSNTRRSKQRGRSSLQLNMGKYTLDQSYMNMMMSWLKKRFIYFYSVRFRKPPSCLFCE
jgi:hypothetical protein